MSLAFSFDIGHSSIGWSALDVQDQHPEILGCGTVVFPAEDCQNQQRAGFRRQRRHIAATRNRIKRLEAFFKSVGLLREQDISECRKRPHPWPWLLAAQVLVSGKQLSEKELWSVIRWYAHNRGYDGNALWAGEDSDPDDVKKVKAARELMERANSNTMCETICALLNADPSIEANPSPKHYFKGENAAFPRSVVLSEVRQILQAHIGSTKHLSETVVAALIEDWRKAQDLGFEAKLPERFYGGLLFGQLKPRFENRIIPRCRITGEKTPAKHSRAFYCYRWAMLVNNLRVEDDFSGLPRPLDVDERKALDELMQQAGYFTKATLKKALQKSLKLEPANLEAMMLVPEMENALTLDPALREVSTNKQLKKIWPHISDSWKRVFLNQLFHGRRFRGKLTSFKLWQERLKADGQPVDEFEVALREAYEAESKLLEKNGLSIDFERFLERPIKISSRIAASGRAPYAKKILLDAAHYAMEGKDPREVGGPLEETRKVRAMQRDAEVDQNSNNHLVRHRIKIFSRTLSDLVDRYADGDAALVDWIGVEVVRDLVQFSGKTAKEKKMIIGAQLAHHNKAVKILENAKEETGGDWEINAGLIKKVRIADDMGWRCPYTGKTYSLNEIIHGEVDREHIIPRSSRPTDSLHALTLTYSHINKEKGARTGMQYIEDTVDQPHTFSPKEYIEFVSKLKNKNGPSKEDESRCKKRKIALLTSSFDRRVKDGNKDTGQEAVDSFTEGSLTQTSYLNKLAAQQAAHWFASKLGEETKQPAVVQLSGSVTAATRTGWSLFDQLNEACPATRGKTKTEIREITHLHHAVDATIIGLAAHYFPRDGRLWALLSRRSIKNSADQAYMKAQLGDLVKFNSDGKWQLQPLRSELKKQVAEKLREKRVVRHNPKTMRGLRVQQNTWRVEGDDSDDDSKLVISMRPRNEEGLKGAEKRRSERRSKLLGPAPVQGKGKLKDLKGALIVEDNYGVALDPEPKVIPYRRVWETLQSLKASNNGKAVRVLRNGDVFSVASGRYKGVWRVHSVKDAKSGIAVDIAWPELVRVESKGEGSKRMVLLKTLIKDKLFVCSGDFSGSS